MLSALLKHVSSDANSPLLRTLVYVIKHFALFSTPLQTVSVETTKTASGEVKTNFLGRRRRVTVAAIAVIDWRAGPEGEKPW